MVELEHTGGPMSERHTLSLSAAVMAVSVPGFLVVFTLWAQKGLGQTDARDPIKVAAFAAVHPVLCGSLYLLGVVMHLAALLLLVGLHRRLVASAPLWVTAGSALGLLWIGADILQNLMHYGIFLGNTPTDVVPSANRAVDALWHAGHFGGGAWVLVIAATSGALFGRGYRAFSVVAGSCFLLHAFVFPIAPWWFNLEFVLVPFWGLWTAVAVARNPAFREPEPEARTGSRGAAAPTAPLIRART